MRASSGAALDRAMAVPSSMEAIKDGRRPLRELTLGEREVLEALRGTALRMMPFYSHMLFKVKMVAVDEDPEVGPDGELHYATRAAITPNWTMMLNFDWIRHEYDKAYETWGEPIRKSLRESKEADVANNFTEEDVREGTSLMAALSLSKVILHELGHAMYDSWDLPRTQGYNAELLNMAEDAVINAPLRLLGLSTEERNNLSNSDFGGAFLKNAIYGGSIQCDDPDHSWHYQLPDGSTESRCNYDQTTRHYYELLLKQQQQQQQKQQSSGGGEGEDSASGQPNQGQGKGSSGGQQDDNARGASGGQQSDGDDGSPSSGGAGPGDGGDDHGCGRSAAEKYSDDPMAQDGVSESTREVSKDVTAAEIERWASENPDAARSIGFGTGSMARQWAQHRRRNDGIKWNQMINRAVHKTARSLRVERRTYSKANRRAQGGLGTIRRGTKPGPAPRFGAAIDTSGSMGGLELFAAYNSVNSALKRAGLSHMEAFAVDSEAKSRAVKIKKADDLAPILVGGGGTNMCAGIDAANNNGFDACAVFTDGIVDWSDMPKRPERIPNMEVIVAVIGSGKRDLDARAAQVPSWMQVAKVDTDLLQHNNSADSSGPFLG